MPDESAKDSSIDQEFIYEGKRFQETASTYGAMVTELENQLNHAKHMVNIYSDAAAAMYSLADSAQAHMRDHNSFINRDQASEVAPRYK